MARPVGQGAFSGAEEEKAKYKTELLPQQLVKFNALYQKWKTHDTYLSVSASTNMPLWGDTAVYGLVRDNIITGFMEKKDLDTYPNLVSLYNAYESIPAIAKWIEGKMAAN
jgi:hypothetical protein